MRPSVCHYLLNVSCGSVLWGARDRVRHHVLHEVCAEGARVALEGDLLPSRQWTNDSLCVCVCVCVCV
jgi:hypothetical protein